MKTLRPALLTALALPVLLVLPGCSLMGGSAPDASDQGSPPAEVVLVTHESFALPEAAAPAVRGGVRLPPRGPWQRRRGRADQQARPDHGRPASATRLRHRQHLRLAGRSTRACSPSLDVELPAGRGRLRPAPATTASGWPRWTRATSASTSTPTWFAEQDLAPPRTLDDLADPAYQGLFVTPRRSSSSPGLAFLLATIGGVRRAAGRTTGRTCSTTAPSVVGGWTDAYYGRLHRRRRGRRPADRAVLRLLAGVHDPEGRATGRPPARCSTPASGRWSTPACWPAPPTPRAPQALVDFLLSDGRPGGAARAHVRLPGRRRRRRCRRCGRSRASSRRDPSRSTRTEIAEHRDDWLAEWRDVVTG